MEIKIDKWAEATYGKGIGELLWLSNRNGYTIENEPDSSISASIHYSITTRVSRCDIKFTGLVYYVGSRSQRSCMEEFKATIVVLGEYPTKEAIRSMTAPAEVILNSMVKELGLKLSYKAPPKDEE